MCKNIILLLLAIGLPGISWANDDHAFDKNFGMSLLHDENYEASEAYFIKHLDGNAVAHYGLATSKFREDTANLTLAKTKEISILYEKAIQLSPGFSDAYFMCAISYYAIARFQLIALKNSNISAESFSEPYALLDKANAYLDRAVFLLPQYANLVEQERESIRKLKIDIDRFKSEKL